MSSVALVDGVSSIECMALRNGERRPELALSSVFSWACIKCTATVRLLEPPCWRRRDCRCDEQELRVGVSGSSSSLSSVSRSAVCFHARDISLSVSIVASTTTAIPLKLKEKRTADPNRTAQNGTHSPSSSVSTKTMSLSHEVRSTDAFGLSGISTEFGRMSARPLNRVAWVSTAIHNGAGGTTCALKLIRQCVVVVSARNADGARPRQKIKHRMRGEKKKKEHKRLDHRAQRATERRN